MNCCGDCRSPATGPHSTPTLPTYPAATADTTYLLPYRGIGSWLPLSPPHLRTHTAHRAACSTPGHRALPPCRPHNYLRASPSRVSLFLYTRCPCVRHSGLRYPRYRLHHWLPDRSAYRIPPRPSGRFSTYLQPAFWFALLHHACTPFYLLISRGSTPIVPATFCRYTAHGYIAIPLTQFWFVLRHYSAYVRLRYTDGHWFYLMTPAHTATPPNATCGARLPSAPISAYGQTFTYTAAPRQNFGV